MKIILRPEPKQHKAYEALNNDLIDVVYFGGGAGGGKTWWICESKMINCVRYPGYKTFLGREELKRLSESTLLTFFKVCQHHKLINGVHYKFNGQKNYIEFRNSSRIDLIELKYYPSDPLYERFGSLEFTDGAIDEAGEVNYMAFDVLKSRIGRHMNKELKVRGTISITGNPKKNWTYKYFYKPFKAGTLPSNIAFIQSLYMDNQYTGKDYERQLSQITDKSTKERLMYGNWEYDDDPAKLIEYDSILDMFTNSFVPNGRKCITADIARQGKDFTRIVTWDGFQLIETVSLEKNLVTQAASEIKILANTYSIPMSQVLVDEDGVGGGVKDILHCKGFINNSRALNNENYDNLKSQCYFKFAKRVNDSGVWIRDELSEQDKDYIIEECEQIKKKDIDSDGRQGIIPKAKVKELIGRSPDWSDVLSMREWFELQPEAPKGNRVL
ncbi:MAG: phage terminase large subunit [Melioribacteraceae bacterium]|jgi:hypothetical protein|nr:phage terminase large subunit [Melioribacteraceae bacterium]